ncbi:hypothetical protein [Microcoleus sp. herbarium14]
MLYPVYQHTALWAEIVANGRSRVRQRRKILTLDRQVWHRTNPALGILV